MIATLTSFAVFTSMKRSNIRPRNFRGVAFTSIVLNRFLHSLSVRFTGLPCGQRFHCGTPQYLVSLFVFVGHIWLMLPQAKSASIRRETLLAVDGFSRFIVRFTCRQGINPLTFRT